MNSYRDFAGVNFVRIPEKMPGRISGGISRIILGGVLRGIPGLYFQIPEK